MHLTQLQLNPQLMGAGLVSNLMMIKNSMMKKDFYKRLSSGILWKGLNKLIYLMSIDQIPLNSTMTQTIHPPKCRKTLVKGNIWYQSHKMEPLCRQDIGHKLCLTELMCT